MMLRKLRKSVGMQDGHLGIAAIFKVSLEGKADLIGTGFWVTEHGHLVTAWHVIEDNIGADGADKGPIYAMQALGEGKVAPRVLRKSHQHKEFDLALSETRSASESDIVPTWPFSLTLDEPKIGDPVFTFAFHSSEQLFSEQSFGIPTARFEGLLAIPELGIVYELAYGVRIEEGRISAIFDKARDSVVMPFPCFQSEMTLYGANSGGPVFDRYGRVCAVNCTSFSGVDISFHLPLRGILDLSARDIAFIPEDPILRNRTVAEMGLAKRVPFSPPLEMEFFGFWQRQILRSIRFVLNCRAWVRWWIEEYRRGRLKD